DALGDAEAEGKLLVMSRRPHRDRDRNTADPNLEWLLDCELVDVDATARSANDVRRGNRIRRARISAVPNGHSPLSLVLERTPTPGWGSVPRLPLGGTLPQEL